MAYAIAIRTDIQHGVGKPAEPLSIICMYIIGLDGCGKKVLIRLYTLPPRHVVSMDVWAGEVHVDGRQGGRAFLA